MYEARIEPALSTSQALVISYNVNSIANSAGCIPMSWFSNTVTLPKFISVPLAILNPADSTPGDTVIAEAPGYPQVASRDPAQWFNEWNYPDGCPPVPGVTGVEARPRPGAVVLSWPDAGLGVGYHVYIRAPDAADYMLKTTVRFVLATAARPI